MWQPTAKNRFTRRVKFSEFHTEIFGRMVSSRVEFLCFMFFYGVGKMEIGLSCHSPSKYCVRIFGRSQGVVEMRRFYPVDTVEYLINLQWRRSHCNASGVLVDL